MKTATIEDEIYFENLVWDCSETSLEEAQTKLHMFNKLFLEDFILYVGSRKPLHFEKMGKLFHELGPAQKEHYINTFSSYLITKGYIKNGEKPEIESDIDKDAFISLCEHPVPKDTLQWYIYNDDVSGFADFATKHNVNIKAHSFLITRYCFTSFDFACYIGSVKIFKYIDLNGYEPTNWTLSRAAEGGNEEILEILISKGVDFSSYLNQAINFHNNKFAKWIWENYSPDFILTDCARTYNTEMLIYFIDNGISINTQNISFGSSNTTVLHHTIIQNNLITTEYILTKEINPDIEDSDGKKAFDYCCSDEMRSIINEYIKQHT